MSKPASLLRNLSTISGMTLISRILGLLREVVMTHFLGASFLSDAFLIAFKLPNFFRRFFAEGAFNAAFIPEFVGTLNQKQSEKQYFISQIWTFLTLFLIIFVVFFESFMPVLIKVISPGLDVNGQRYNLAISLARITFPFILFISLTAMLSGILNSLQKFAAAAFIPALLNIFMILSLPLAQLFSVSFVTSLSASIPLAGLTQTVILYYLCKSYGLKPGFVKPKITDPVKRILKRMGPAVLGAGVFQINVFVDMILASFLEVGSLSYIYFADRLYQLPLALIGIALGTALLPTLSKYVKEGAEEKEQNTQRKALFIGFILSLPACVGLIVLADPIIGTLFGHGAFDAGDVYKTKIALAAFAIGLIPCVYVKVFLSIFYAHSDTRTPLKIGLICIAINLLSNSVLLPYLGHVALALSTSATAWTQMLLCVYFLNKKGNFSYTLLFNKGMISPLILNMILGSFLMMLWGYINSFYADASKFSQVGILLGIIGVYALTYLTVMYKIGFFKLLKKLPSKN